MATEDEQSDYAKRRVSAHYRIFADDNLPKVEGYSSEKLQNRNITINNGGFAGTGELLGDAPHPRREIDEAVSHFGDRAKVMKTPVAEGKYPLAFITADIDRNVRLADGTIYNAAHGDTSALDAATQNLAPGQSVQDAGMGAVEAAANAAAQETRDRMRAGRDGIESPPSQWAQDVNNLFTGLTSAARRAAERLNQPQAQAAPATSQPNEQKVISLGKDGMATTDAKPKGLAAFSLGSDFFATAKQEAADELDRELFVQ